MLSHYTFALQSQHAQNMRDGAQKSRPPLQLPECVMCLPALVKNDVMQTDFLMKAVSQCIIRNSSNADLDTLLR